MHTRTGLQVQGCTNTTSYVARPGADLNVRTNSSTVTARTAVTSGTERDGRASSGTGGGSAGNGRRFGGWASAETQARPSSRQAMRYRTGSLRWRLVGPARGGPIA